MGSVLKSLPLSLLIFSVILLTGSLLIDDINENYDSVNISKDGFNDSFDTIDEIYDIGVSEKDKVYGDGVSETDTENSMLRGGFSALSIIPRTFELVGNILNDIEDFLGFDHFFIRAALAAIAIIVTLSVIFLLFRVVA